MIRCPTDDCDEITIKNDKPHFPTTHKREYHFRLKCLSCNHTKAISTYICCKCGINTQQCRCVYNITTRTWDKTIITIAEMLKRKVDEGSTARKDDNPAKKQRGSNMAQLIQDIASATTEAQVIEIGTEHLKRLSGDKQNDENHQIFTIVGNVMRDKAKQIAELDNHDHDSGQRQTNMVTTRDQPESTMSDMNNSFNLDSDEDDDKAPMPTPPQYDQAIPLEPVATPRPIAKNIHMGYRHLGYTPTWDTQPSTKNVHVGYRCNYLCTICSGKGIYLIVNDTINDNDNTTIQGGSCMCLP